MMMGARMTRTAVEAATRVNAEFETPWRDEVPVFACCRKSVAAAVDRVDLLEVASMDVTARVAALRSAVDDTMPGHLAAHRCCAGHLANLAFDLPDLVVPAEDE